MELKAVRIIHDVVGSIDFFFLAEFFRLSGIYVVEQMEGDAEPDKSCYDVTIGACRSDSRLGAEDDVCIHLRDLKRNISSDDNIRKWNSTDQITVLTNLIGELIQKNVCNQSAWWDILIGIYVNRELVLHSMNLQFYFKKASFAVENARNAFRDAYKDLVAEKGSIPAGDHGKKYYDYARIYCKVKVNAGCKYMGDEFEFYIEGLGNECIQCINLYPEFSNLKVLLGLCYEHTPEYARVAIQAFHGALEYEKMKCYASHIYYWIGKRYEELNENWGDVTRNYQMSHKRKPKYKNIYKLAIEERIAGNYYRAIEYFQEILKKLEKKMEQKLADPLELEYYFKSYAMITVIFFADLKDYFKAVAYGEDIIKHCGIMVEHDKFYDDFYGDFAADYRELTKKRFDLKRINSILYYSYQDLGLEDKAEQCRKRNKSVAV